MPKGPRKVEVKTRFRKTYGYYYHYYDENLHRRTAQRDGFATEAEALAAGQAALKLHRRTLEVDTAKITFADFDGPPQTFDVIPSGGVCAGTVGVTGGGAFDVALVISSGADSRTVLLATGLGFHNGGASWTPAAEKP